MSSSSPHIALENLQYLTEIRDIEDASVAFLRHAKLAVTPENYAVAYEYFSPQGNPDLKEKISAAKSRGAPFTQHFCSDLHARHLSLAHEMQIMKNSSTALQNELDNIIENLQLAGEETNKFGDRLGSYSADFSKMQFSKSQNATTYHEVLKPLVEKLLAETQHMEKKNRVLEEKLNTSSHEVRQLRKNLELVRAESLTDQLTQIGNRKFFEESFYKIIGQQPNTPLSLFIGDIDHFKHFNDSWGHQMGDQVLKIVAKCLKDQLREKGMLARYGGEEFVAILPDVDLNAACAMANEIRKLIYRQKMRKKTTGESIGQITISFGVATLRRNDTLADLIGRADAALYAAKDLGRNMVVGEADLPAQKSVNQ